MVKQLLIMRIVVSQEKINNLMISSKLFLYFQYFLRYELHTPEQVPEKQKRSFLVFLVQNDLLFHNNLLMPGLQISSVKF